MKKALCLSLISLAAISAGAVVLLNNPITAVHATTGTAVTAETMAANTDKLLPAFNHSGTERLAVSDGVISSWSDGYFFYNDVVDSVSFDLQMTTAATRVCMALRADGGGTLWSSKGYYVFFDGTNASMYTVNDTSSWNAHPVGATTAVPNIFDGNYHYISFGLDATTSSVTLTLTVDSTTVTGTDSTDAVLPSTGTEFKIAPVSDTVPIYKVGKPSAAGDYTVNYTTADAMVANSTRLLPAFNYSGAERLAVSGGIISSWQDGGFYYGEAIDAVNVDLKVTNTATDIAFALRTNGGGNMWGGGSGYYLYISGTTLQAYKVVTATSSEWNKNMLGQVTVANLFDSAYHNVKFYAVTDSLSKVQIGVSIDNATFATFSDASQTIAQANTEFKIVRINTGALFEVKAPAFVWANSFLSATSVCDPAGLANNITTTIWDGQKTTYNALASDVQTRIKAGSASGTSGIDQAIARYDYIVAKYSLEDFMGLNIVPLQTPSVFHEENKATTTVLAVGLSVIALAAGLTFVIAKRHKKQI
jgi:hypothetical protein